MSGKFKRFHLPHVQQLKEGVLPIGPRFPEIDLTDVVRNLFSSARDSLAVAFHRQLQNKNDRKISLCMYTFEPN